MSRIQSTSFSSVVSLPVTAAHGATPPPAHTVRNVADCAPDLVRSPTDSAPTAPTSPATSASARTLASAALPATSTCKRAEPAQRAGDRFRLLGGFSASERLGDEGGAPDLPWATADDRVHAKAGAQFRGAAPLLGRSGRRQRVCARIESNDRARPRPRSYRPRDAGPTLCTA
jgi:hypothetical protein